MGDAERRLPETRSPPNQRYANVKELIPKLFTFWKRAQEADAPPPEKVRKDARTRTKTTWWTEGPDALSPQAMLQQASLGKGPEQGDVPNQAAGLTQIERDNGTGNTTQHFGRQIKEH